MEMKKEYEISYQNELGKKKIAISSGVNFRRGFIVFNYCEEEGYEKTMMIPISRILKIEIMKELEIE